MKKLLELVASKFIEKEVAKDGNELRSLYKQPNYLANLDSKSFLLNRNKLLVSFICAVAQIDLKDQDNKTFLYSLATAVEMIYFLRNQNLILPHAFLMNLVQSFISGSKVVSVINGKASPAASYTSYKRWITERGDKPVIYPGNCDVITFFDNIGRYIVKNYRVLSSKKESADIVTAVLHFQLKHSNLQTNEDLMPGKLRRQETIQSKNCNIA